MEIEETFEELVKQLQPVLMNTIWRILRHSDMAKDVLQETLTTIWKNFYKIRQHANPRALVIKISANKAYDCLRKLPGPKALKPNISIAHFEGAKQVERQEIRQEILHALVRLPKKQALAVYLRMVEEEPYSQIALVMGCQEGTVRNHVKRARKKLSKWLSHLKHLENI